MAALERVVDAKVEQARRRERDAADNALHIAADRARLAAAAAAAGSGARGRP